MVANSWMHTPAGGHWQDGSLRLHQLSGRPLQSGYALGGPPRLGRLPGGHPVRGGGPQRLYILSQRHVAFFTKSFKVARWPRSLITPAQIYLGDGSGQAVARYQPAKLGAIESHWETNPPGTGRPWTILAWPDPAREENSWTFLTIPRGLSLLVTHSLSGRVPGLRDFPPEDRPPILIPYYCFRVMAGIGFFLFFLMLWSGWQWHRGRLRPEAIAGKNGSWLPGWGPRPWAGWRWRRAGSPGRWAASPGSSMA